LKLSKGGEECFKTLLEKERKGNGQKTVEVYPVVHRTGHNREKALKSFTCRPPRGGGGAVANKIKKGKEGGDEGKHYRRSRGVAAPELLQLTKRNFINQQRKKV